jgi:uncharacterized protein
VPLLLDTGVLYALTDRDDAWHQRCADLLEETREPLLVPITVVPEAVYLIQTRLGPAAEAQFIRSIAERELNVQMLDDADWRRTVELMVKYPAIGFVDASVITMAERLRLTAIATTDRRHFSSVRPKHRASFELLP